MKSPQELLGQDTCPIINWYSTVNAEQGCEVQLAMVQCYAKLGSQRWLSNRAAASFK